MVSAMVRHLAERLTEMDHTQLVLLLKKARGESVWHQAIRSVLQHPHDLGLPDLIDQLASQANDDPVVMSRIVGWDATILLLRFYNQTAKP